MAGIKSGRVTDEISSITRNAKAKGIADSGGNKDRDAEIASLRATKATADGLKRAQATAPDVTSTASEAKTKAKKVNDIQMFKPLNAETGEGE